MSGRALVRIVLVVLAIAVTIATVTNVFLDNGEVRALAEQVACAGATPCAMTRMERTPIHQTFAFTTKKGAEYEVECTRSAVLFGPYACVKR